MTQWEYKWMTKDQYAGEDPSSLKIMAAEGAKGWEAWTMVEHSGKRYVAYKRVVKPKTKEELKSEIEI